MGGGSRTRTEQTQQQTQQQVMDPEIRAAFLGNYNRAVGAANNMGVRQFADFTPDQLAAFEATRNAVGAGNQNFDAAGNALNGLLNFNPGSINYNPVTAAQAQSRDAGSAAQFNASLLGPAAQAGFTSAGDAALAQARSAGPAERADAASINRGDIRQVQAERLRDTDLGAYMNPYTTGVIDTAMGDLERSRQMARGTDAARAAKAGAFGGSRQAVLESETNRAYDDNAARTVAGLRSSAFENAQRAAMGDISNQMTAGQFNAGIDANVAGQNAGFRQSSNQFNAGQANQMGQFNAGLGQQAELANAAARNNMSQFNAGQQNQLGQFNAGQTNQFGMANQSAQNQVGLANTAAQNQMSQFNAGLLADTDRFNVGAQNQMGQFNAGNDLASQQANLNARLASGQLGLSAAGQLGQLGQLRQASGLQGAAALENIGSQQQGLSQARLDAARNIEAERLGLINQSLGFLDPNMGATVNSSGSSRSSSQTRESMGLGQIAGIALQGMALMSDKRAKEDIERVGDNPAGGGVYRYRMKGTGEEQIGLLAQEVEKRDPGAVVQGDDGYKRVNYTRATGGLLDGPVVVGKRRKKKKGAK